MTKKNALQIVAEAITSTDLAHAGFTANQIDTINKALEVVNGMREQLNKPRSASPEAAAKRKAKNVEERRAKVTAIEDSVFSAMDKTVARTAAEIAAIMGRTDWSAAQVQYLLLHELATKVEKIETEGKSNVYRLV